MRSITDLKDEKTRVDSEHMMETLIKAPYRFEIENEANRKVETYAFRSVFIEIRKDEEISNIIKQIIP